MGWSGLSRPELPTQPSRRSCGRVIGGPGVDESDPPSAVSLDGAGAPEPSQNLPLELVVRKQTGDTARLYGLGDRGVVAPGYKADLNVIDLDGLALRLPELVHDLPGGARRLIQRADGYVATVVAGEVTMERGEDTGARPGRLIRGMR